MINFNTQNTFYLIPQAALDELIKAIQDLRELQKVIEKGDHSRALGDYLPEEKAMELLGRGKTWFWNKRKTGELIGKKAAGRWYYSIDNLKNYIEGGRSV